MSAEERPPRVGDFLDDPTRDVEDWRWLWTQDARFPTRSHRGLLGRLIVFVKRLLRPLVTAPQNDLWERQRVFNLILLEYLDQARHHRTRNEERIADLEAFVEPGLREVMSHNDALFARVDQKLDRYRRQARDLVSTLGEALAVTEAGGSVEKESGGESPALRRPLGEDLYRALEERHRGEEADVRGRIAEYLPRLEGHAPVLDLGCGRGEALIVLGEAGIEARGVDSSRAMVSHCRAEGLDAIHGDLLEVLAGVEEGSLGAVVSFHVVEHLPVAAIPTLFRLARRALRPGGLLILETPNPLSLVVAARSFWLDPTHVRPVHPDTLRLLAEETGFTDIERLELRPFPDADRLPEIPLDTIPEESRSLADRVNRLRDRLDDLLFGYRDYAIVARKA